MHKKSFVSGFLIASIIFSSQQIFAVGGKIQAYLCDNYNIEVDEIKLNLPDGMRILNFGDRTYTPARLIAEAMGGTVKWDDSTKTVKITKPEPKVVEKIVEKIVEVPVESETFYQNVPLKIVKNNFILKVNGISSHDNLTYIYLDAENKSGEAAEVDYSNAKIKSGQDVYSTNIMSVTDWGNSMDVNEKREGKVMVFEKISGDKITLTIPVKSLNTNSFSETFEFNLKVN